MGRSSGYSLLIGLLLLPFLFGLDLKNKFFDTVFETFVKIEPCHPKKVCVIFILDECNDSNRNYVWAYGVDYHTAMIWEQSGKCKLGETHTIYATIEIELHDLYTWSVVVTSYRLPIEIGFSFSNATIKFHNDTTAEFQWFSRGVHKVSLFPAQIHPKVETGRWHWNLEQRSFNISANGEKLITIMGGPGLLYTSKTMDKDEYNNPKHIELNDTRFLEKLDENTFCNFTEIVEKCYDNCDKLKDVNKTVYCSSQMWYHNPSRPVTVLSLRDWKKVEACALSVEWEAGDSNTMVDHSLEVQCSKDEPAKLTATSKQILGFGICGPLLLLMIGLIVFFFVARYRRRMRDENTKASTKQSSESTRKDNKSEYFFKKSDKHAKSTDREGKNTDRHTKSSTRAVGRSPESPVTPSPKGAAAAAATRRLKLLQEPKGAENAAGPPLPEGFVSESLA